MELDFERCYRATASRDARFDGFFVIAVRTTRIYCRPSCPAITPRRENVRFLRSAAAAQREGFRACLRCRPDAAPGSPEWDIRADVVSRAIRLIADGVVDRDGVPGLARRLGYTVRHLHRMLSEELGAGPVALARAQRSQTARTLIETTALSLTDAAFAAGFGSVRQFNDTIREVYGRTPSQLRDKATPPAPTQATHTMQNIHTMQTAHAAYATQRVQTTETAQSVQAATAVGPVTDGTRLTLRLPYRAPLHAGALLDFLCDRTVPGVENRTTEPYGRDALDRTYTRILRLPRGMANVALTPYPGHIRADLMLTDIRDLAPAVTRCRRIFDLDADPEAVDEALAEDPALAPAIAKEPGVRVPGGPDGFELAVRAIVGQQVSVASARRVLGRLVNVAGSVRNAAGAVPETGGDGLARGFPDAVTLLTLRDEAFPMPRARRQTIRALAEAVVNGGLDLDGANDRAEVRVVLLALPGIGPWTADYIALRALRDPDIFLATDLGVRRGAAALDLPTDPKRLAAHAERWRPWRSYAVMRLWRHA